MEFSSNIVQGIVKLYPYYSTCNT